jgi:hypothetical protein
MTGFASIVDWGKLFEAAYVSAAFGLGVMLVGGLAVVASLRAQDVKERSTGQAVAYNSATGLFVLLIVAAAVFGIYIMTQK